jgi:hypothetical protein
MTESPAHLPDYALAAAKAALLEAGASGTVYSLVMPESERALSAVVDGGDREALLAEGGPARLAGARDSAWLSRYREPWTQKQDSMHEAYFERWLAWSAPVLDFPTDDFPNRYPTAGASEGIFKIMAEYAAGRRAAGAEPVVHVFEGEYEGFPAYAEALAVRTVRHDRSRWEEVPDRLEPNALFWISQPSAIDGALWAPFERFAAALAERRPDARLVPDLTYVGSVARAYRIGLDFPNIPAVLISHSKPFGGYYHRVGGVLARREYPSLFGNRWFKNLLSLAWGTEMMTRHGVFDLPRRYRPVQEAAAKRVGERLGLAGLEPADVLLLATAPAAGTLPPAVAATLRGSPGERRLRLCLTPTMTCLIDPALAPGTAPALGL